MVEESRTNARGAGTGSGTLLRVEESGSGPPLVLVHGSWDDRRTWDPVQEGLAAQFRVVTYDRRGHSDSRDGPVSGTRRDDEDDLARLVDDLGLAPAHVVGNSFGGSVALGLAVRRPELFRTLSVHEPPLLSLATDEPALAELEQAVGSVLELLAHGQDGDAARDFVENVALGPGAWEAMPAEERALMVANAPTFADEQQDPGWADIDLDGLSALDVPVLITRGDPTPPFFSAVVAQLEEAIGTARVATLPGAGHVPQATRPEEYVAVVRAFAGA